MEDILNRFKRGKRIEYRYAFGKIVQGKVIRRYSEKEVARHAKTHGPEAAARLPEWIVCEMEDEAGSYRGAFHFEQLRITDNRA